MFLCLPVGAEGWDEGPKTNQPETTSVSRGNGPFSQCQDKARKAYVNVCVFESE